MRGASARRCSWTKEREDAMVRNAFLLPLLLLVSACRGELPKRGSTGAPAQNVPAPHGVSDAAAGDAAAGVEDPRLRALLRSHWEEMLSRDPVFATRLGDHRHDDRLPDRSYEARRKLRLLRRNWLGSARAIAASGPDLSHADKITLALFIESIEAEIESEVCLFEDWTLSATDNPVTFSNELAEIHQVKSVEDGRNLISRYRTLSRFIDTEISNLRRGASQGLFTNAESTMRVVAMLESELGKPSSEWAMVAPAKKPVEGWTKEEWETFGRDAQAVVEGEVRAAFARYLDFLQKEILPRARDEGRSGLLALPFGRPCYGARIRTFTTLKTPASVLHETGRLEIERINQAMQALGRKVFGTDDLGKILERLRSDPTLYFASPEEIEDTARHALHAARSRLEAYFGALPKADCIVARIPDYEAPFTTIAYYRPPVPDGTKPGEYFVNVHQPRTRPRYEAEALAFHESVPGHHLQIAIAQEVKALPAFRKHLGMTAFVEGWALYAEQLADEMGLYSSDIDRMGKLSYEAWRASRLVVDTGIHAMGWSRQAAKGYMLAHTALAPNNIDNEVDRYIVWPGQALAYKTGQLEILRLRGRAEKELGPTFDLKTFHDVLLGGGAVSLPVLEAQVDAWIRLKQQPRD